MHVNLVYDFNGYYERCSYLRNYTGMTVSDESFSSLLSEFLEGCFIHYEDVFPPAVYLGFYRYLIDERADSLIELSEWDSQYFAGNYLMKFLKPLFDLP